LIDQGYAFKVITHLDGLDSLPDLVFPTKAEQVELLSAVLLANESDADLGTDIRGGADDLPGTITTKDFGGPVKTKSLGPGPAKRIQGSLNALSGASSMSYIETNRSANKQLAKEQGGRNRHKLFRKRDALRKEARKA